MKKSEKTVAVTMGDPAGIGPEVVLKSINHLIKTNGYRYDNFIIIGSADILYNTNKIMSLIDNFDKLNIFEVNGISRLKINTGEASSYSGFASYEYIKAAVKLCNLKKAAAAVTAPISKTALKLAGINYSGHTEIFQAHTGSAKVDMAFYGRHFCLFLITRHIALKSAVKLLNIESVYRGIINAAEFMRSIYVKNHEVEIIVAGVNPHASENGIFGNEEEEIFIPAIKKARAAIGLTPALNVSGPEPADTAFYRACKNIKKTIVVSAFHDQGLAPFKLLHFETGVNVTLGLPFVRTSPDHGTAFQIAGLNKASPASMINALKLAFKLKPVDLI